MIEIKFRGMNTKGEWVYGSLVNPTHGIAKMPNTRTKTWIVESAFENGCWFNVYEKQYVRPKTVGQFTGLKDADGSDIYEGDIYHQGDKNILYVAKFSIEHQEYVGVQNRSGSIAGLKHFMDRVKVIGNIHENPELLKP